MRIAMVSEHASPLAAVGGVDAGGQNVHVLELGTALAGAGHEVTVWTRRTDDDTPDTVTVRPGMTVRTVTAGPRAPVPKDELVPYLPAFARVLGDDWGAQRPDVVHAHFWMSGMAAVSAAAPLDLPVVQTFHALGSVKRRHQGTDDTSPPGRVAAERAVVGRVDRVDRHLHRRGLRARPARRTAPSDHRGAVRRRHGRLLAGRAGAPARRAAPDRRAGPPRPAQGRRRGHRGPAPAAGGRAAGRRWPGRLRRAQCRAAPRPRRAPVAAGGGRRRGRGPRPPARRRRPAGRAGAAALGRRRGLRAVVRAVRDRAAGGHGVRAAGGRQRGRRHPGHRRGPGDGPARAPAPARRGGRRAADAAGDADPGTRVRHRGPGPRAGPLRLGPHRGLHARRVRGGARRAGGQARTGPGGRRVRRADGRPDDDSAVLGVAR